MTLEEHQNRIVLIKARKLELAEEMKMIDTELYLEIGHVRGYQEAKAEYEKKFDIPLSPEIEAKIQAIIRDVKAKAEAEKPV